MSSARTKSIPESAVVHLWQEQLRKGRHLDDCEGMPVEVIYPGRLNDSQGGDFRDAVVASGKDISFGCIEVHTRASGWQAHGHHLDPVYNHVVLHVALEKDNSAKTLLQNGKSIPTVILDNDTKALRKRNKAGPALTCKAVRRRRGPGHLEEVLERAGDRRFEAKAARYREDLLSSLEAGECLYQGFMEALGYVKNQDPFLKLSRAAPLKLLEKMIHEQSSDSGLLLKVQSFLLGKAALLPSQRSLDYSGEDYISSLERAWLGFSQPASLSLDDWQLFKVRPGNYPVRRIVALSYLIFRFREKGWFQSLLDLVHQLTVNQTQTRFESALMVTDRGFWACHYDFGAADLQHPDGALLGRGRAEEIIVNVLLPFFFSWYHMFGELALSGKVKELFARYPRLESNSIERHMLDQLALNSRRINSARRQQGLIQIYKNLCMKGRCGECILVL
jgi:hypothetical protein